MKKALIYILLLIAVTLSSCKKDRDQTNSKDKLYPVTYQLSNFTQKINSGKTQVATVTPDQSDVTELFYRLYDTNGKLLSNKPILKGQPAFGTVKDSLKSGNYVAVFLGITGSPDIFIFDGDSFYYQTDASIPDRTFHETFYNKTSFTVANDFVQQSIVLNRLTAQVQVVISDKIPAGVDNIVVTVYDDNRYFSAFANTSNYPWIPSFTAKITPSDIGSLNYTITSTPILNTQTSVYIEVAANSVTQGLIAKKTISNITLQRNTRTILTGNLFTNGTNPGGFNIKFNGYDNDGISQGF